MLHTLHFSLQNVVYFIILPFLVPVLFTFYIQGVLKSGTKRLTKVKLFLHMPRRHTSGTAPPTLNVGAECRWCSTSHPGCSSIRRCNPLYPLTMRLVGTQGWSGPIGADKKLLHLLGLKPQKMEPGAQSLY